MSKKYWGYETILDISGCKPGTVTDPKHLTRFLKEMVERIGMVAYGDPQVVHFAEHDEHLAGYTCIQLLETSSLVCHFVDWNSSGFINVFSCSEYSIETVKQVIQEFFEPEAQRVTFLTRNAS